MSGNYVNYANQLKDIIIENISDERNRVSAAADPDDTNSITIAANYAKIITYNRVIEMIKKITETYIRDCELVNKDREVDTAVKALEDLRKYKENVDKLYGKDGLIK